MNKPLWLRIFKHHLHGNCSSGSLGSAGRCTSSSDMLDLEKRDRNGRDGDWRGTFVDLQNSSDIFSVCSIPPVCEWILCIDVHWYTVLYSFWACNGDEPALLRHRAQLQTGQKGVVDLSVWWSEILWNIYLGPLSNGRSTACESWINVQGRFKVQVESLRVNLQVQTK